MTNHAYDAYVQFDDFNSHTPREVWPADNDYIPVIDIFQLTHPSRGVTGERSNGKRDAVNFNSHTPREVWLMKTGV